MSPNRLTPGRSWPRAVGFRVAAVLLGLLPFALIEGALRLSNAARPDVHDDPFVGFIATRPLFELDASGQRFEIAPSRRTHFYPDAFAAQKPRGEFRIFCIGDSTVQGNPWTIETAFSTWLELSLNEADSSRRWEVINCGGISYASYRMVPILEEILERYQPDAVIVHASHNEFLEDRTYAPIKRIPAWLRRSQDATLSLRIVQGLRSAAHSALGSRSQTLVPRSRAILPTEVVARLDHEDGLKAYHRDPTWRQDIETHFEFNVRRMTSLARQANVPLILLNPACNLRDSPPFKAEPAAGLSDDRRQRFRELWEAARSAMSSRPRDAVQTLREALAIDDQHAGLHYDLAQVLDTLRDVEGARAEYELAKELDVCPLRILTPMNEIVRRIGVETRTPVIDLRSLFDRLSRDGIRGADWFADHVHPTIPGQQRIADELANELVRQGMLTPHADWNTRKDRRYAEHEQALPPVYFAHAQQRLQALMNWAHGRGIQRSEVP